MVIFDLDVLNWLLSLQDQGLAFGPCGQGGVTMSTEALSHCGDNVVQDKVNSGKPSLPHRSDLMRTSTKKQVHHELAKHIPLKVFFNSKPEHFGLH